MSPLAISLSRQALGTLDATLLPALGFGNLLKRTPLHISQNERSLLAVSGNYIFSNVPFPHIHCKLAYMVMCVSGNI